MNRRVAWFFRRTLPPLLTSAPLPSFVEEAFLVVLGASLLGAAIGAVVAWAFGQQQALFTAIPV